MNTNLYNDDQTPSTQQLHLSKKPRGMSKEKRRQYSKRYAEINKEKVKEYQRQYREANKEKAKEYRKSSKGRTVLQASSTKYFKKRRNANPLFRLEQSLRAHCCRIVKNLSLGNKPTNTFKWIGCSPEELKVHIESLFIEGMNWNNYGKYGWHVDHIRPVSSFKPEEWEQINHYTNLQPLWWQDNLAKSNKWNEEKQET